VSVRRAFGERSASIRHFSNITYKAQHWACASFKSLPLIDSSMLHKLVPHQNTAGNSKHANFNRHNDDSDLKTSFIVVFKCIFYKQFCKIYNEMQETVVYSSEAKWVFLNVPFLHLRTRNDIYILVCQIIYSVLDSVARIDIDKSTLSADPADLKNRIVYCLHFVYFVRVCNHFVY
jgi:hypothetical protein